MYWRMASNWILEINYNSGKTYTYTYVYLSTSLDVVQQNKYVQYVHV